MTSSRLMAISKIIKDEAASRKPKALNNIFETTVGSDGSRRMASLKVECRFDHVVLFVEASLSHETTVSLRFEIMSLAPEGSRLVFALSEQGCFPRTCVVSSEDEVRPIVSDSLDSVFGMIFLMKLESAV
jgi:hypothetical protein